MLLCAVLYRTKNKIKLCIVILIIILFSYTNTCYKNLVYKYKFDDLIMKNTIYKVTSNLLNDFANTLII